MKKLYKINLFLVALLVFTSCALDDDPASISSNSVTYAQLSKAGEIVTQGTNGESVNITLSQTLDTDTKVEYTVNGTDNVGFIEAGSNSLTLDFPTGVGVVNTVKLVGATGLYNNVALGEDTSVIFVGLPDPSPNDIVVMMTNSANSGSIWLGLSQFNADGSTWIADYEGSINGRNPRICNIPLSGAGAFGAIPNSADIDPNTLAVNLYPQATLPQNPTDYNVFVVMPDGTYQSFSGSIPASRGVDNAVVKVVAADDSANPGQKTYTFSEF